MHAFLHGVMMYVIEVILSPMNPSKKYGLVKLVDKIVVPVKSSLKKVFKMQFLPGVLLIYHS